MFAVAGPVADAWAAAEEEEADDDDWPIILFRVAPRPPKAWLSCFA